MTISKFEKLLEKPSTKLKQGRDNYRDLHMQKENLKELIVKLGVKQEDKAAFETLLQSSQIDIQELRHNIKMPAIEHV